MVSSRGVRLLIVTSTLSFRISRFATLGAILSLYTQFFVAIEKLQATLAAMPHGKEKLVQSNI